MTINTSWAWGSQQQFPELIVLEHSYQDNRHWCRECEVVHLHPKTKEEIVAPEHGMLGERYYKCKGNLHPGSNVLKKYHSRAGWVDAGDINREAFELASYADGEVGFYYTTATGKHRHDFDYDEGEGEEGWLQVYDDYREKYFRKRMSHMCVMWIKAE